MTNKVFNTPFEFSLRVMLILACADEAKAVDEIAVLDFISVYGKAFGIAESNLHGDNEFKYGEFVARLNTIKQSVKSLAIDRFINAVPSKNGLTYMIAEGGKSYINSLQCDYAAEYREVVKCALTHIGRKSMREVIAEINQKAVAALRIGG